MRLIAFVDLVGGPTTALIGILSPLPRRTGGGEEQGWRRGFGEVWLVEKREKQAQGKKKTSTSPRWSSLCLRWNGTHVCVNGHTDIIRPKDLLEGMRENAKDSIDLRGEELHGIAMRKKENVQGGGVVGERG